VVGGRVFGEDRLGLALRGSMDSQYITDLGMLLELRKAKNATKTREARQAGKARHIRIIQLLNQITTEAGRRL
jgi:hypothetical protein